MVEPSKISYYLSLIGGSFTILTGTIPLITYFGLGQSGYLFGGAPLFSFLIISGSGIVSLIFAHRLASSPKQRLTSSLIVIAMALVAWWGIITSRTLVSSDFTSVGPFLSFAGGIVSLSGRLGHKPEQ